MTEHKYRRACGCKVCMETFRKRQDAKFARYATEVMKRDTGASPTPDPGEPAGTGSNEKD